jgi:UDP-3-O-[3-hydroxymyristoyl] glucosamine N-acyltransferase
MSLTLAEIARLVEGQLTGDGRVLIHGAATLPVARRGEITLADHPKLAPELARCQATAVIVPATFQPTDRPIITVASVHAAFAKIVTHFRPPRQTRCAGISPAAWVDPSARIADNTQVHPHAFVGEEVEIGAGCIVHSGVRLLDGCKLGPNCTLFPNAVLYENTILGEGVIIHANAVLACSLGYSTVDGRHQLNAHRLCRSAIRRDRRGPVIDRGMPSSSAAAVIRQPRADRPQLPPRPAQPDLLAVGIRKLLDG